MGSRITSLLMSPKQLMTEMQQKTGKQSDVVASPTAAVNCFFLPSHSGAIKINIRLCACGQNVFLNFCDRIVWTLKANKSDPRSMFPTGLNDRYSTCGPKYNMALLLAEIPKLPVSGNHFCSQFACLKKIYGSESHCTTNICHIQLNPSMWQGLCYHAAKIFALHSCQKDY